MYGNLPLVDVHQGGGGDEISGGVADPSSVRHRASPTQPSETRELGHGTGLRAERLIHSRRHGIRDYPKRRVKCIEEAVNEKAKKDLANTENIYLLLRGSGIL